MAKRRATGEAAKVPHEGPMVATFWKRGRTVKLSVTDVSVAINPFYAEIICACEGDPNAHLFVVSDDPDIEANMAAAGETHAYDGFLLRDSSGRVIEQIRADDIQTVH